MDEIRLIDSAPDTKTVLVNGVPIGDRRPTGDAMRDIALIHDMMRKRGIHKEISKADGIMQHAVSFSTTARLLYDRGLAGDKPHDIFAAVTFAVNSAFAIELYFKTLGEIYGTRHELRGRGDRVVDVKGV